MDAAIGERVALYRLVWAGPLARCAGDDRSDDRSPDAVSALNPDPRFLPLNPLGPHVLALLGGVGAVAVLAIIGPCPAAGLALPTAVAGCPARLPRIPCHPALSQRYAALPRRWHPRHDSRVVCFLVVIGEDLRGDLALLADDGRQGVWGRDPARDRTGSIPNG